MSQSTSEPREVVGVVPWLSWPLSAWPWWTEPVRAERLALLRIGVALCLLVDIALNYAPETFAFFGKDALGDPTIFHWRFQPPRMTWSLLRGVCDNVLIYLSLVLVILTTCWIVATSVARLLVRNNLLIDDRTGAALVLWSCAFAVYTAGLWSHMIDDANRDFLAWIIPLGGFSLACLFFVLDLFHRLRDDTHRIPWLPLLMPFATSLALAAAGVAISEPEEIDKTAWWVRALHSWQDDRTLLVIAMGLWLSSAFLLLIGCGTRFAAILTWMLSMSFGNANSYLDNAGDTIRMISLLYLMLCPCGAVWSVDAMFKRRPGPVYVHPWPIRLIFVQMIFIYFINGLYKCLGADWLDGTSLHYVLGDLAITRFSQAALPLPFALTQGMTWSVMAWEVTFPVLVLWKWPRRLALCFGVLFHLGIFATMELGGFVPYALCMYLPLIPWETNESRRAAGLVPAG